MYEGRQIGAADSRIQSWAGQLGTTSESIEQNLEKILKRSERWGAVLLLDEADVYIRRRTDDLEHNAIVAGFLRTLEYFHGLLFLTTNRGDDVDDAIQSRMIAVFKYDVPIPEDAAKIWRILADEFKVPVTDKMIAELLKIFPKIAGRDIKGLLKLVTKYIKRKKIPLTADAFRKVGVFRGLA